MESGGGRVFSFFALPQERQQVAARRAARVSDPHARGRKAFANPSLRFLFSSLSLFFSFLDPVVTSKF